MFQAAIKGLILERFDIFNARQQPEQEKVQEESRAAKPTSLVPTTNGYHAPPSKSPTPSKTSPVKREASVEPGSEMMDQSPKKKKKSKEPSVDADAAYAARLQAEEDKRTRPTRGGHSRKAAPVKKKTPKKKTAARIRGSDESDVESSSVEKKPKNTGFNVSIFTTESSAQPNRIAETNEPLAGIIRTSKWRDCCKRPDLGDAWFG